MRQPSASRFMTTVYPLSMGVVFLVVGLLGLYWTFAFTLGVFQIRHSLEASFTYTAMDVVTDTLRHRTLMLAASLATLAAAVGLLRRRAWGRHAALALLLLALVYVPTSFAVDTWQLSHADPGLYNAVTADIGWAWLGVGLVSIVLAVLAWLMARVPWRLGDQRAADDPAQPGSLNG